MGRGNDGFSFWHVQFLVQWDLHQRQQNTLGNIDQELRREMNLRVNSTYVVIEAMEVR